MLSFLAQTRSGKPSSGSESAGRYALPGGITVSHLRVDLSRRIAITALRALESCYVAPCSAELRAAVRAHGCRHAAAGEGDSRRICDRAGEAAVRNVQRSSSSASPRRRAACDRVVHSAGASLWVGQRLGPLYLLYRTRAREVPRSPTGQPGVEAGWTLLQVQAASHRLHQSVTAPLANSATLRSGLRALADLRARDLPVSLDAPGASAFGRIHVAQLIDLLGGMMSFRGSPSDGAAAPLHLAC